MTGLSTRTRLIEAIAITSSPRIPAADSGGVPTYGPGEVIEFTVTFGDTVDVIGIPVLKISRAEGTFDAEYAGGTGSDALRFDWTVPTTLLDRSQIRISSNFNLGLLYSDSGLVLNGATLTDSGVRPVNVRHARIDPLAYADATPPSSRSTPKAPP